MLEYLVKSIRGRQRFQENNRILNLQEIKPNEVPLCVQELLDAFLPVTNIKGLKIEIENQITLPDENITPYVNKSLQSERSLSIKPVQFLADWYLYQLTLFHLV